MSQNEIKIELNGKPHPVVAGLTVKALIESLDMAEQRLAVEVNQEIVPRSEHAQFQLSAGDQVEIVRAIGGGQWPVLRQKD